MAEHGLDRLEVGAAGQGEGGSVAPEVVEPDRGPSLPADELGEPAGQVPGRAGTSARAGEDVPVAPRGLLLPAAVGGEDLQGPGIEGQDPVAGDALGRQQHQPAAGFLQLTADRQRGSGEVDVAPAEPGRLTPAQPGNRHELIAGIEGFATDRGEEPGSLPGGPHRDRGPHAGLAPGGLARGHPDHWMRACRRRQLNQPGRVDGDQPFADRRIKRRPQRGADPRQGRR